MNREQCEPVDGDVKTRISFEGSADDPRIFVSMPKSSSNKERVEPLPSFEWEERSELQWPLSVRFSEGSVQLLMRLMPEGDVQAIKVLSSYPDPVFETTAIKAARGWRVRWKGEPPAEPICYLQTFLYCGQDKKVSLVGCDSHAHKGSPD